MTRSNEGTGRMAAIATAAALLAALAPGLAATAQAQSTQQRLQNQQGSGMRNLQGSSNQLNQSLRNTQNQLNDRANMQGLEQRQTIENMQQDRLRPNPPLDPNAR